MKPEKARKKNYIFFLFFILILSFQVTVVELSNLLRFTHTKRIRKMNKIDEVYYQKGLRWERKECPLIANVDKQHHVQNHQSGDIKGYQRISKADLPIALTDTAKSNSIVNKKGYYDLISLRCRYSRKLSLRLKGIVRALGC